MIEDSQISSASSVYGTVFSAHEARLDGHSSWTASTEDVNPWIQVTFDTPVHITGVITQGDPNWDLWVSQYKVEYSNDDGGSWQYVTDTQGNVKVS